MVEAVVSKTEVGKQEPKKAQGKPVKADSKPFQAFLAAHPDKKGLSFDKQVEAYKAAKAEKAANAKPRKARKAKAEKTVASVEPKESKIPVALVKAYRAAEKAIAADVEAYKQKRLMEELAKQMKG